MIESVLEQNNAECFKTIMAEFAPKGGLILDVTAGHLQLWKDVLNQTYMIGGAVKRLYEPVFMDLRPLPSINFVHDFTRPFSFIRNGVFDGIMFDPPYAGTGRSSLRVVSGSIFKSGEALRGLEKKKQFESEVTGSMSYQQLRNIIPKLAAEFYRMLKPSGIIILKCSDFREEGEVFPFASYVYGKWDPLFALEGYIIQHIPTSGVKERIHVRVAHNTWTVWRNRHIGR
jgi:hypothetical protein